ncbi:MAG: DinB family protein [candidate division Zixibacteria bacterium]|nr:DinB family protein [candidate division Zixibacteria bacterium]
MFVHVSDFLHAWKQEMENTIKILGALTDDSLKLPEHEHVRSIGQMAWHITTTIPEMIEKMGVDVGPPTETDPIPESAQALREAYEKHANKVISEVSKWQDPDLQIEDDMYGMKWQRSLTLWIFIKHEIHHRGQLTVLMRLAGLTVPGIYGPAKEEWVKFGMQIPEF